MKPIIYSNIIDFNQETQYIKQSEPVDMGEYIFVGLEIHGVEVVENDLEDLLIEEMGL